MRYLFSSHFPAIFFPAYPLKLPLSFSYPLIFLPSQLLLFLASLRFFSRLIEDFAFLKNLPNKGAMSNLFQFLRCINQHID